MSYRPQIKGEKTGDLPLSNPSAGTHCKSQDCQGARPRNTADAARMKIPRWDFTALLSGALSAFHCVSASAQEGYYGAGHDKWHQGFYSTLKRNDGQGSCCNLMDCRPTQSRMVGDHYEVKVGRARWWCSCLRSETGRPQQRRSILRHPPVGGLRSAVGRCCRKRLEPSDESKDWCAQHNPGSPIKEFGADAAKRRSRAMPRRSDEG
jgi:hypothetical protein